MCRNLFPTLQKDTHTFFCLFYWSIIALQCCVSFFHTTKWVSYTCTYIPTVLSLPSSPTTVSALYMVTERHAELPVLYSRRPLTMYFTRGKMARWHHWPNGRESEWTPGVGDGQGGLACCDSWGRKESDTTERLNWTELSA